jgi:hypothetical protein
MVYEARDGRFFSVGGSKMRHLVGMGLHEGRAARGARK